MNKKELEAFVRRAAKDISSGSERYKVCGGGLQSSPIQHDRRARGTLERARPEGVEHCLQFLNSTSRLLHVFHCR